MSEDVFIDMLEDDFEDEIEQPKSVLHLTLHRKWFNMIASGIKKEEYREIKPYWNRRLLQRKYDAVFFRNGYSSSAPKMLVEVKDHLTGLGVIEWGAPYRTPVHIIRLGRILRLQNYKFTTP